METKKTVAVLFGGRSAEYTVSLQSAYSVIQQLSREKYHLVLLGITRQGKWLIYDGEIQKIKEDTWWQDRSCVPAVLSPDRQCRGIIVMEEKQWRTLPVDVVFPVLHGINGEDGTVQGLLELAGIPYVGCGILSSAVSMDKDIAHRLIRSSGIATPRSIVLYSKTADQKLFSRIKELEYPLFVKPANAGSSFGITQVFEKNELPAAVEKAFEHDGKVVIEETISGFEVGCAILGNHSLTIGEVDEIELTEGFFDYEEKYTLQNSKIYMPARIDGNTSERIKETAVAIYRTLNCSGLARVDLFLTPEKDIVFNEVNTLPGFTSHSRYPNMLKGIGMTFENILDELIGKAMQ